MSEALEAAAARAAEALARGTATPADFNALAWQRLVGGDAAGAAELFQRALALAPADPEALVGMAGLLRGAGRLRDAALHCDAAIAAAAGYAEAWLERGHVMMNGGSMAEAQRCYRQVVALDPGRSEAHAALASIASRAGEAEAVRRHAAAAPDEPLAAAALAALALEEGDPAAAYRAAAPMLARLPSPSPERIELRHLEGDALARLGDADGAYRAYSAAKADFATLHAAAFHGRPPHRAFIAQIADGIAALDPSRWPPADVAAPAVPHVFVLGYPRSGNTLVENVLASVPGVLALEERPTLREADTAFLAEPGGLARFDAATEADLSPYRNAYWDRVARAGLSASGKAFVDMDPLKAIRLPLIARLFPAANVLLVRRDPRDVVWSCFRTSFALSNAALDFTTLEGAARHYDALMRLTEAALARLPLRVREVHYHRMVQDFDAETRAICAFAGLPWSEDLRRFDRTAKNRGVSTASARQVRRGLYDGTRQWEPFAHILAPVMPILDPWIERLGYG